MTRRGPGGAHWAETGPGAQSVVSHTERDGREAQRPQQPAGACHVSPGRASSRAAPPPCLARHTRCARARTAPHSSGRVLIPGPDHSKLSRHAQLTPSVSLSARPPSCRSLSDPTAPDAGLMMGPMASGGRVVTALAPVRTCSGHCCARDPWDWPVHVVYCTVYFVLSCHVAHCPVTLSPPSPPGNAGHSLPLPGSP